jgi:hypothetical protein
MRRRFDSGPAHSSFFQGTDEFASPRVTPVVATTQVSTKAFVFAS